jgi:hypothetical protein
LLEFVGIENDIEDSIGLRIKIKNKKKYDAMTGCLPGRVPLNWYRNNVTVSLELLDVFIRNVESQIELSIQEFKIKKETLSLDEEPEFNYSRIIDIHLGLDSETFDLENIFTEYFPSIQRRSAFLSLYGFLEHELDNLCALFKKTENLKVDLRESNHWGIERSIKYLEIVAGLTIDTGNDKWGKVKSINKIRNLLIHNDGKLDDIDGNPKKKERNILKQNKYLSGDYEIIFSKGYLSFVLKTFNDFFKYLDELIQNRCEPT